MSRKLKSASIMKKLAVLAVSKAEGDNISEVSQQVIADYLAALETIKNYNKNEKSDQEKGKRGKKKAQLKKVPTTNKQVRAV
ncbi:MAG: hypothetical protein H6Q74_1005 [Firmicutes bacterium]|nr:hypothetical protein [Bacillota bacterium]